MENNLTELIKAKAEEIENSVYSVKDAASRGMTLALSDPSILSAAGLVKCDILDNDFRKLAEKVGHLNEIIAHLDMVLRELIRLKALKDSDGETDEYNTKQPIAWERARQLISLCPYNGELPGFTPKNFYDYPQPPISINNKKE